MDVISIKPLLAVFISAAASVLILLSDKKRNLRETWTMIAATLKFIIIASMIPAVLEGNNIYYKLFNILPGIPFAFRVDAFGLLFGVLASFLWILTSVYSIGYVRGLAEHAQTRYFASFAIALSSTIGVAFAANLLTLFVFYEILTLITYPLVIHKQSAKAKSAGRKYLVYTLSGGVVLLFAIIATYSLTGSLGFTPGGFLYGYGSVLGLQILFAAYIVGFGVKAAFMPLHSWLPSAMVAPTPVSALLHAVAVVKAGVFGVVRTIFFVFGPTLVSKLGVGIPLAYFVAYTILVASMFALTQDNLKKMLAYSTISQLSYIILGAAYVNPAGLFGGVMHIAHHAFMKITLFFCAGAIYVATKKKNISELDGIGKSMPYTMAAFSIAAFGMAGFPPVCGYLSKWYLLLGSVEANQLPLVAVLLSSALLNVAYFFPIIYRAYFKQAKTKTKKNEAPALMLIPLTLTAAISIILGLWPDAPGFFYGLVELMAKNIFGGI
ncbi:MAG: cation:proton antiporter [Candidatus Altiarchaeales archaeon ex4484_96]|nr:MAG: cation:proton antiporter [Candidatus Altiarchaeales archaeon ex4484_96]